MAIIKGATTLKTSEEEVVYSEDSDVTPDASHRGCGWIPLANAKVQKGADIVEIKALPPGEASKHTDLEERHGARTAAHYAAARGTQKVNGARGQKVIAWVDCLAQQNGDALERLGKRIMCLTRGRGAEALYAETRRELGFEEVVDDDAASKSVAV